MRTTVRPSRITTYFIITGGFFALLLAMKLFPYETISSWKYPLGAFCSGIALGSAIMTVVWMCRLAYRPKRPGWEFRRHMARNNIYVFATATLFFGALLSWFFEWPAVWPIVFGLASFVLWLVLVSAAGIDHYFEEMNLPPDTSHK